MTEQQQQNERQAVANLQRYLRQLAFDDPSIPSPPIDGIFESVTRDALRAYQKHRRLPVTGVADLETWRRLFEDYNESLRKNTRGLGFDIFPRNPVDYALTPNEEHFLVEVIQYILNELRVQYNDIPGNGQSGVYDTATAQGIRVFQRRNGLAEADRVDRTTWNALAAAYRRLSDRNEL